MLIWTTGAPVPRIRSASRRVSWSPSMTATGRVPASSAMVRSQQRRLARSRRAHQVQRDDAALGQPGAVVRRQVVVLGEQRRLDLDDAGARGSCPVRVPVPWPWPCRPRPRTSASPQPQVPAHVRPPQLCRLRPARPTRPPAPDRRGPRRRRCRSRTAGSGRRARTPRRRCGSAPAPPAARSRAPRPRAASRRSRARSRTASRRAPRPASRPTRTRTHGHRRTAGALGDRVHHALGDRELVHRAPACPGAETLRPAAETAASPRVGAGVRADSAVGSHLVSQSTHRAMTCSSAPGFGEQMRRPGDHGDVVPGGEPPARLAIELPRTRLIGPAPTTGATLGRSPDATQCRTGEIGLAAPRHASHARHLVRLIDGGLVRAAAAAPVLAPNKAHWAGWGHAVRAGEPEARKPRR